MIKNLQILKEFEIDDETLKQLNNLAYKLSDENLPKEFFKKILEQYLNTNSYQRKNSVQPVKILKKWEVVSSVLDFYKSIDEELYKKIYDIIMNNNQKIKFNIYNKSDIQKELNSKDFENPRFRKYKLNPCNTPVENYDNVYIPLNEIPERSDKNKK